MEWRAPGILLATRRHGESAAIIEVFTEAYGRHAGLVRGGASEEYIAQYLATGWSARADRYSELRSLSTIDLPKVEMSRIGG